MEALWDFSFKKFFAPKVIGFLYGLGMFVAGLSCVSVVGLSFKSGFLPGIGALVISPILFLSYIIVIRIILEGMIAVIRVAEESVEISKNMKMTADNTRRIR